MPQRVEAWEEVIFLDYPAKDPAFMDFIRRYATESRPKVMALMATHPDKTFTILRSPEEAERLLSWR